MRYGKGPVSGIALRAALIAAVLTGTAFAGCGEQDLPPSSGLEGEEAVELIEGLSADQSRMVGDLGYPDHFFISIDPDGTDRVERWTYFSRGKVVDFDNGRFFGEEECEDESEEYPPTQLRPQDFDALLTPEEASRMLGEPLYIQEIEDSLMPENTIIVYDRAILLYRDGKLIGVDTKVSPPELSVP
ncbi:MAG: hypothetical protein AB1384_13140 [Actinomycetota bacterium]